jgi:hypothetical protein
MSGETYNIDMRTYMIEHHRRLWYREPKQLQHNNNDHWWAGPEEWFTRTWVSLSASALGRKMSMTSYWNAYKLYILMQSAMAMLMAVMSRARNPPSMPLSHDEAHTMIGDITKITVSYLDNDLHLVWVSTARLASWMPDILEEEIWRTVSLSMFLLSLLFTSLLRWILAQYKWRRHGFLPSPETPQLQGEIPRTPDPPNGYHMGLLGIGTYGFLQLWTLTSYLTVSLLLFYRFIQPQWSAPNVEDNVMARLYVTCPGPGNTRFIYSACHEP